MSDQCNDTLIDIQTKWCLDDVMDFHEALDIIEALQEEDRAKRTGPGSKP